MSDIQLETCKDIGKLTHTQKNKDKQTKQSIEIDLFQWH